MLKRALFICLLALLPSFAFGVINAFGQANNCINAGGAVCGTALTGNAISATGYNPSVGGALFVPAASSLQSGSQLTLSYDIKSTSLRTSTSSVIVDTRVAASKLSGFLNFIGFSQNPDFIFMFAANPAGDNNNVDWCRTNNGRTCTRETFVNDGNWHHVCQVFNSPSNTFIMIDGVIRDFNNGVDANNPALGYTPGTSYWSIGLTGVNNYALREFQSKQVALLPSDCSRLYQYHLQNLEPSTGSLAPSTWSISLPMNNCNGSGCADNSGNTNNAIYDSTPPVCTITGALANGFSGVSGNQTATISCTDAVGVSSVNWYMDGVFFASSTTPPFSVTLPTANYEDASHTITAVAQNPGFKTDTVTSTGTTSNGNSAITYYVNSSTGSDSNNCTSTGTPCASPNGVQTKINATKMFPGSSILFAAGQNFNITSLTTSTVLYLAGQSCNSFCDFNQNVTAGGHVITIGTYGGSGNCHVEAAVTTDCASITLSANGTASYNMGMINAINVQNVLTENIRLFGSQTNAIFCSTVTTTSGCSVGIRYASANSFVNTALSGSQDTATNVEVVDFHTGITVSQQLTADNFPAGGPFCGGQVTDSYVHGSTTSSGMGGGITVVGTSCSDETIKPSASIVSNVVNDVSGEGGAASDGSGIVSLNSAFNVVDNFNVTGNVGQLDDSCGGPYGNWWFQSSGITVTGNESYNVFPAGLGACDNGAFDLDNGAANAVLTGNYGHNTWGPAVEMLDQASGGIIAGNNSLSYNIFENTNAETIDNTVAMLAARVSGGFVNIFNNTLWNGFNGTTNSPETNPTKVSVLGINGTCPSTQSYEANNIAVTNSNNSNATTSNFFYGGFNLHCTGTIVKMVTNDWFSYGSNSSSLLWSSVNVFNTDYTTLATWNVAASANDIQANPGLSGSPPLVLTCYVAGSGVPIAPGGIPCPTGYEITHSAATENTGTDLSQAPYSLYTTTTEYFGGTVPYSGHGGSGTNIGADGVFR